MKLLKLDIDRFRNIKHISLGLDQNVNIIVGNNGSGKSSILEALHCLSSGRSFRTIKTQPIVNNESEDCIIHALLEDQGQKRNIGIQKFRHGKTLARVDQHNLSSQADLAKLLAVVGISPESEDPVDGTSKYRQSYIDWSLFHVEQKYLPLWKNYARGLKQRNNAIRQNHQQLVISSWDHQIADSGEEIDLLRKRTIERLTPIIESYLAQLLPHIDVVIKYRRGWSLDYPLIDVLHSSLEKDIRMGHTLYGPHRADLKIQADHTTAKDYLSRGQKKLVALAFKFAQAKDFKQLLGIDPVFYIDDLPAELDKSKREQIFFLIRELDIQTFISATSREDLPFMKHGDYAVFHVEQGALSNVVY